MSVRKPKHSPPPARESRPRRGFLSRWKRGTSDSSTRIRPRDPVLLRELGEFVLSRQPSAQEIHAAQREIHHQTLALSQTMDSPNFRRVGVEDLRRMVRLYDQLFFEDRILPAAEAEGLEFSLSSRMTRIAGRMTTLYDQGRDRPRKFELALSTTLLFQTFEDVDRPVTVTGRHCRDRLEAMQRVAEHEFTHLMEMLIWNDGTCSQPRFQGIAKRCFGHTDYQHDLITQQERAARKFNIRVGDQVRFRRDNKILVGRVNRITRRATVLVPSTQGEPFTDGNRYMRFYVPLERLQRIDKS